jgi:hypothetical protein
MRESRTYGSARGGRGNPVPYRYRCYSDPFLHHVKDLWRRSLQRRSQTRSMTWERMAKIAGDWLPKPLILHPWPSQRFAVKHSR